MDTMEMSGPSSMGGSSDRQQQLIREFELKRRSRSIIVPTNDQQVRSLLRGLGEPITLFGERELERRERLRGLLTELDAQGKGIETTVEGQAVHVEELPVAELFYTEGTAALLEHRRKVATASLKRASDRLRVANAEVGREAARRSRAELAACAREVAEDCSEFGDDRPISDCCVSTCGELLVTGSWSGKFKVWRSDGLKKLASVEAHGDNRITGVAIHPSASASSDGGSLSVCTASSDSTARLWSASGKLLRTLEGHTGRLGRVAFDPLGFAVATASFDNTWRLWDCETGTNLLEQEGHSREVYSVGFQCDGSLAVSCGLDAIGRGWDLRTGKCVRTLRGHVDAVLSAEFSPNGHHVATGSDDHTCKIWDLRMGPNKMNQDHLYTIAAHRSLVSRVRFSPSHGSLLMTSSYDRSVKLWDGATFALAATLEGHENKVMGCSFVPGDIRCLVSVGYDRTVKTWRLRGEADKGGDGEAMQVDG